MRHSCLTSRLLHPSGWGIPASCRMALAAAAILAVAGSARASYPPGEVPGVTAIAGDGWAVILWPLNQDPNYSAGLDQITSYFIYRTPGGGAAPVASATVFNDYSWNSYVRTRSFWDDGLVNGQQYTYVIRAGARVGSNTVFGQSTSITLTPQEGYTGTNGPIEAQSGDRWVKLKWYPAATGWAQELGVTIYNIYRATHPGKLGRSALSVSIVSDGTFAYTDLVELENKVPYYYMIFPGYPERTPYIIRVIPVRPISPGGQPLARMDGSAPRRVRVSWAPAPDPDLAQSNPLSGYVVYRSDDGGGTMNEIYRVSSGTLSIIDEVPAYGKRYVYLVRPIDVEGRLGDSYPLAILDVELPSNRLYLNHNRFRPRLGEDLSVIFQITEPGRVIITVMSLTGERIKTLYDREHAGNFTSDAPFNSLYAGLPSLTWDGRNDSGQMVGSGAYMVILEIGKHRYIGSVAVIR